MQNRVLKTQTGLWSDHLICLELRLDHNWYEPIEVTVWWKQCRDSCFLIERDLQHVTGELNAIRDTVSNAKSPADPKVLDNRQCACKEEQQQSSHKWLLWQVNDKQNVTDETLRKLFHVQLALTGRTLIYFNSVSQYRIK